MHEDSPSDQRAVSGNGISYRESRLESESQFPPVQHLCGHAVERTVDGPPIFGNQPKLTPTNLDEHAQVTRLHSISPDLQACSRRLSTC